MSEHLPIKVAPNPQPSSSKAAASLRDDDVSREKQREFNGVLSNQVKQQDTEKTQETTQSAEAKASTVSTAAEDSLPQDGKALPAQPGPLELVASNSDAEQAITELVPVDETGLDIELPSLDASGVDTELSPEATASAVLAAPVSAEVSKLVESATPNVSNDKPSTPVTLTAAAARLTSTTIAGEATDDTAQAQAANQLRKVESLEGNVISLVRHSQDEKTAFQTSKIIEQFTEVSARPVTSANTISAAVSAMSPVNTYSSATSSATGLQQVSIEVPVQHQQWQRAFAERVVWSVGNNQSVQVRVNPAELGPIDIQVNVSKEQTNITFNTAHAMTRDSIEAALPRLRDMLASEGLNLGDVDVRHQDSTAQGQTASQEQGSGAGQNAGPDNAEQLAEGEAEVMLYPVTLSERTVDYYI